MSQHPSKNQKTYANNNNQASSSKAPLNPLSKRGGRQNKKAKHTTEPYPTQKAVEAHSRESDQNIWAETFKKQLVGKSFALQNLPPNSSSKDSQQSANPNNPQQ